ncbi:MAG: acyltransferase [Bacteroidota bacterium]
MQSIVKHKVPIFGLDLLRSIAIGIVVLSHTAFVLQDSFPGFPFIPTPDGVDLFFVLSGFLIGTLLLQQIQAKKGINIIVIFQFLKRRWFKTLPSYYVFLLLNILLVSAGLLHGSINKYALTYFAFFQNFYKPFDFFFWESWSLAVEEWFYLLFPFLLLLLHAVFKSRIKWAFLWSVVMVLILPLLWRLNCLSHYENHDLYFRRMVLARLDTIAFGLLGAFLNVYFSKVWNKFKYPALFVGLSLMIYLFRFGENYHPNFYKTYYGSLEALSILLLLPFLNALTTEKIQFRPFRFTAKISYAMYLVNLPLILLLKPYLEKLAPQFNLPVFLGLWLLIYCVAYCWYRFFEKPVMDLRDR